MPRARKLPKALTDECAALLVQCNKRYASPHRNLCMLRVMLEAGLHYINVLALQPAHLNTAPWELMVQQAKNAKDRTLRINDDLRDSIGA